MLWPRTNDSLGRQYAVQEGLADDISPAYICLDDDELLVTKRCVIWSRGGVFRKCYRFDLEKEDVSQALLTTFPSVGPLAGKKSETRAPAIVVFLKTQAHVSTSLKTLLSYCLMLRDTMTIANFDRSTS